MSYSFGIRATTKGEVLDLVKVKMDEVVTQQPVHAHDRAQAEAAVQAFVALLPDDETMDVNVSVSGYVSGAWVGGELEKVTGASVSVSAHLVSRVT